MHCLAYLQTPVLQCKLVEYFVSVNWNVIMDVGHTNPCIFSVCQPGAQIHLDNFIAENVHSGVAVETGRLAKICSRA